ncbi:GOLPH3/VPS74 family protein [Haloechinothrix halophila]|uniref:GOLPH3/VPS74 family protein n=1 Tax=Haloechinothrix halophila TaxID=1069073 RepID=UPI0006890437|nr:GPP34 family phosphoprotein [Haloechinothrix halophila]
MLLAEDLLLLSYDDDTGRKSGVGNLDYALAGAVLIDLADLGRLDVTEKGRLTVVDDAPTGQAVLDDWLGKVAKYEGKKPKDAVSGLSSGLADRLLATLAERGILREEKGKVLGIFPTTRWPAEDSSHELALRERLRTVLVSGAEPDERTAPLIALLSAVDAVGEVVEKHERKDAKQRAEQIAEGDWASAATKKAVEELTAAVAAAVIVPTVITGTS